MDWFLTNNPLYKTSGCSNYSTNIQNEIFIDGYIIPRKDIFNQNKKITKTDLIKKLHKKFHNNFIDYIKGVFVIIIFNNSGFQIFSDRHSIKKYFIYQKESEFFISSSLSLISKEYDLKINNENAALFSLTSHFFNGNTLFKHLKSNKPAQQIIYKEDSLKISNYWNPNEIFQNKKTKNKKTDYSKKWVQIINSYIEYLQPKNISFTLTGGNDSRMVLAALLTLKKNIHSFTFGNPKSYDGVISSKLKTAVKLNHHFYYLENPSKTWFHKQAQELIRFGQSLINIHRAHRNDALKKEQIYVTDLIFTGLVGGEYFKEPSFDDKTIPKIFKELLNVKNKTKRIKIITDKLNYQGFKITHVNIEKIDSHINSFLNYGKGLNKKKQKFIYTYLFYGCTHQTQDPNVFGEHIKHVVNPFMDIDFLEMMASHPAWYVNKKINFLNKFFHSIFYILITHNLSPELSHIPYAKRGNYTANDILNHKFKYIYKRVSSLIKNNSNSFPANFPMDRWLNDFCKDELSKLSPETLSLFNIKDLNKFLDRTKNKTIEKDWHLITNPINLNLIYEQYKKN